MTLNTLTISEARDKLRSKEIKATELTSGEWLKTSAGTYVQITAITRWTAHTATVHNLTVSDLHTYYVVAGNTPVLVHNTGACPVHGGSRDCPSLCPNNGGPPVQQPRL